MPRPRILVTRRWPEAVERRLCELFDTTLNSDDHRLSADELRAALRDFDAVLPTVSDRLDASVLTVDAPRARILANYGVGYSHIDIDAETRLDLVRELGVTRTPTVLVLDPGGAVRQRIVGAPRKPDIEEALQRLAA